MPSRRHFLAGLAAATLAGSRSWAAAGAPKFLSCAADQNGDFLLCGLNEAAAVVFAVPLPARGHAGAAHPDRAEVVVFARRPGDFALLIDCVHGTVLQKLETPAGRHFYGHGAYSADGALLFTTENDFEEARGVIGVWDTAKGYARAGEFPSGGIGPHEIKRLPHSDSLVVANGGIETHPESGRTKLNIPTMAPNLAFIDAAGSLQTTIELQAALHKNSIRHLDMSQSGDVVFGMQWQGPSTQQVPLIGIAGQNTPLRLIDEIPTSTDTLAHYVGSIACSADGRVLCVTSPRGNVAQLYQRDSGRLIRTFALNDVCGLAAHRDGFLVTHHKGQAQLISDAGHHDLQQSDVRWDNHIVAV